jgi:hypothetical protein
MWVKIFAVTFGLGVVYRPVVRLPNRCFTTVFYDSMDDENIKVTETLRPAGGV